MSGVHIALETGIHQMINIHCRCLRISILLFKRNDKKIKQDFTKKYTELQKDYITLITVRTSPFRRTITIIPLYTIALSYHKKITSMMIRRPADGMHLNITTFTRFNNLLS